MRLYDLRQFLFGRVGSSSQDVNEGIDDLARTFVVKQFSLIIFDSHCELVVGT